MKRLGMKLFVASDAFTFAALLLVYWALRVANSDWPRPFSMSPAILYATGMTAVLLASSLTMLQAVRAMGGQDRRATFRWLSVTILFGTLFLVLHLTEWRRLMDIEKITPSSGIFGSVFFAITGLHMAHVAAGLVYLSVLGIGIIRGRFTAEDVQTGCLYWQFVDIVWLFIFPSVYLLAVKP